ncbi:syndecan-1 [Ranitomeya variabilis]|uniref:syndecan-1 n=1 Tax=Ranitomeya variabilis TaxID=490064 RepID=UPI004055D8FC
MDALPALCLLLLCSLTVAVDETVPLPEDLDGSGDDEDFSGSGSDGFFVDSESKDVTVFTTSISTLVPTVEGSTAAQEPEIVEKEETKTEDTTKSADTTASPSDDIKDPIAVDTDDAEATTKEAITSPPFHQEETEDKKHHHHHHHPHHHTTTSSTTLPSESGGDVDDTTDILLAVDLPEQTTTNIPDTEPGLHHVPQELTTPVEDLAKHGVFHGETTSGATSTYVDNEEAAVDALDNLPALVTTTVAEESRTHEDHHPHHHHHHHHPPHHHTTTTPFVELGVKEEETTKQSDPVEPESNAEGGENVTTVSEDEHPPEDHHHVTTTTMSAEPEKPPEVHTPDTKGRRIHVPDDGSTTAVPVISEDEHLPEDTENDDFTSTTAQYNVSRSPFDENDEISDSKEEGPSGVADEDIFFESTNSVLNEGRMNPSSEEGNSDDGSSDASHGIMERKELLAGIIAGGVAGLVFAAALVVFVLYRMKKKDEGSYSLEEPKQSNGGYQKPREQREFYA